MIFREALMADIPQIQIVRNLVKENTLSDPSLVPDADVLDYITRRGKGWVAEDQGIIMGFAIVSVIDNNVWALFIHPDFEKKGIGKILHNTMMNWYFEQTNNTCWLSTTPGTRAEKFYRSAGWIQVGLYGKNEYKFEMTGVIWRKQKLN